VLDGRNDARVCCRQVLELVEDDDQWTPSPSLILQEPKRLPPVGECEGRRSGQELTALPGKGRELERPRLFLRLEVDDPWSRQGDPEQEGFPDPASSPQDDEGRWLLGETTELADLSLAVDDLHGG
jgi:hypothetical protein